MNGQDDTTTLRGANLMIDAAIARERFKLNGPYVKAPVFIPGGDGLVQVPNQFLLQHEPTGSITSTHSVTKKYQIGKPEDMDVLDLFSGEITRGGSMKNESVSWLSSGQETWTMPDGQEVREIVSVFKDWTGTGADRIVRHKKALECRNFIRSALAALRRVWSFDHTKRGRARFDLFKSIAAELGRNAVGNDGVQ